MTLKTKVARTQKNVQNFIYLIKANGGWKYRKFVKLSDNDLKKTAPVVEQTIFTYISRLCVAEHLLEEEPTHYKSRWKDYQDKLKELRLL